MSGPDPASRPEGSLAADALVEFCEAALHTILAERSISDANVFARERFYGLAVQRARYPPLCAYIAEALQGFQVGRGGPDRVGHEKKVVAPNQPYMFDTTRCLPMLLLNFPPHKAYVLEGRVSRLVVALMDAQGSRWEEVLIDFSVVRQAWQKIMVCRQRRGFQWQACALMVWQKA